MAALYQQARPITFEQVIGQEHVKDLLVAALQKGRIGHAYLFSGPRGVGKTTTARLLAMAVNCSHETIKPCGECESCMLVRQASHPDVIELDAASNNSVEDIRDLREKVNLSSIRGGSRVWVLDEAHMLTKSAANALLKTLEEPPSNLVFILATTEPEKLPATILSRCQHYRFRRLSEAEIGGKLQSLCDDAKIEADPEAIALIARAADGAMRDGESLLERLLSQEKPITRNDAEEALGLPPQERIEALAANLMGGNLDALFTEASGLYRDGFAPRTLAERLKMSLRDAVYTKLKLEGYNFELKNPEKDILKVIHALDEENERFTRYNDLFSLEVALIKAHNSLVDNEPGAGTVVITQTASQTGAVASPATQRNNAIADFDPHANTRSAPPAAAPPRATQAQASIQQPTPVATGGKTANWNDVKKRASAQLKAFLLPGKAVIEGSTITITFSESKHTFHFTQLKSRSDELRTLVDDVLGKGYTLQLEGSGGNLTLKPDAADAAAGVSPQPVQQETKAKEISKPEVAKNEPSEAIPESNESRKADEPLIQKVSLESSKTVETPINTESQSSKRSIKAPDTIPDSIFSDSSDSASKKEPTKKPKADKKLEAISKNDTIVLDDLDAVLPNTETEFESLSGDFWGEDSGSPIPQATKPVEQPKEAKVPQTVETQVVETQVIETKVIDKSVPTTSKPVESTSTISEQAIENTQNETTVSVTKPEKDNTKPSLITNTSDVDEETEVDGSELAVKARLEQLQILFPGQMSLMETFDKTDDTELEDVPEDLENIVETISGTLLASSESDSE